MLTEPLGLPPATSAKGRGWITATGKVDSFLKDGVCAFVCNLTTKSHSRHVLFGKAPAFEALTISQAANVGIILFHMNLFLLVHLYRALLSVCTLYPHHLKVKALTVLK